MVGVTCDISKMYFTCEIHKKQFTTIEALKDHVAKVHPDESSASSPKKVLIKKIPSSCSKIIKRSSLVKQSNKGSGKQALKIWLQDKQKGTINAKDDRRRPPPPQETLKRDEAQAVICKIENDSQNSLQCHICEKYCPTSEIDSHLQTHFNSNLLPEEPSNLLPKIKPDPNIIIKEETPDNGDKIQYSHSCHLCFRCFKSFDALHSHMRLKHSDDEISSESEESIADNDQTDPDFVLPEIEEPEPEKYPSTEEPEPVRYASAERITQNKNSAMKRRMKKIRNRKRLINRNSSQYANYIPFLPTGTLSCYFCSHTPAFLYTFERHMWKHTLERPYRCKICSRACRDQETLDEHAKSHNRKSDKGRNHKCKLCGSSFKDPGTLNKHLLTHSSHRPFACSKCSNSYKRLSDLKRHMMSVHQATKQYKCEICSPNKEFSRRDVFKSHMKKIHPGIKYEEPANQYDAIEKKETYLITCYSCDINFSDYDEFLKHKRKFHSNNMVNTTHRISDNPKSIKNKMLSSKRTKSHEEKKSEENNAQPDEKLDKLKCNFCDGRRFGSEESLKSHMKLFH